MVFVDCVAFYYEAGSRGENYLHKDNFHIQVSEELSKLTVQSLRRILWYVALFFPKLIGLKVKPRLLLLQPSFEAGVVIHSNLI